jgi:cholesterol oxidase
MTPVPRVGTAYQWVAPTAPRNPVVPSSAPAALRLPIADVR